MRTLIGRYLRYFESHGHRAIPGAPVVPENDPSVLFTTAGMHPLVPFLLGEPHPAGRRLANLQKCLRTDDIENVGDGFHHTFFLMLGNWSLGDYFKDQAIAMSFEFLTSPDWLGIDPRRLHVTVFAGDADAPRDEESIAIWQHAFALAGIVARLGERIYAFGKKENWWGPVGATGPCGPDTEMFYDTLKPPCSPTCDPSCSCGKYIEIWNDVFMAYDRQLDGTYAPLAQRNVDTGMGVARVTAVTSGHGDDDYRTELFRPLIASIEELSGQSYGGPVEVTRSMRIVADHLRAAVFAIADGAVPSNVERGYIVRRLIRRAIRHGHLLGIHEPISSTIGRVVIAEYAGLFPELAARRDAILTEMAAEEERFGRTLSRGLVEFEKWMGRRLIGAEQLVTGEEAFDLYQTYGFPLELTAELAAERGLHVDEAGFHAAFAAHQEISRSGQERRFAGGLGEQSAQTTRLHTATHLLHAALRRVLGAHVQQKGSNITAERLRFDFSHPRALTAEELRRVEELVNQAIRLNLAVQMETMALDEALASGALAFFGERYGERVKVYAIGNLSREVCGGPHVAATGELQHLRIVKEQSSGQGVRRIRAVLGDADGVA